jgi:hypothetical protein
MLFLLPLRKYRVRFTRAITVANVHPAAIRAEVLYNDFFLNELT